MDEIEVSILGPGVGESQVLHLGANMWVVIDSFRRARTQDSAPLAYLKHRGIDPDTVRHVIATHWHDDHVAGISDLYMECPNAVFTTWLKINESRVKEAIKVDQAAPSDIERTMDELRSCYEEAIKRSEERKRLYLKYAGPDKLIARSTLDERRVELHSISPREADLDRALAALIDWEPPRRMRRRSAGDDNATSVATILDAAVFSAILGADLEGNSNYEWGWGAVVADSELRPSPRSTLWKVAHHGSPTAHHKRFIDEWLASPFAVITPYARGRKRLPSRADVERVARYSSEVAVVSSGSVRIRATGKLASTLRSTKTKALLPGADDGLVVARRKLTEPDWTIHTDGSTRIFSHT